MKLLILINVKLFSFSFYKSIQTLIRSSPASRYTKKSNLPENFTIIEGQKNKTIHVDSNSVTILGHSHNGIILQLLPESTCFSFEIIVKYGNPSEFSKTKAIISQESKTLKDSENST